MNKPRMLLVDDEEPIRLSIQYALGEWYDVTAVETTVKALELLQKEKFNIVLLDMRIRGEDSDSALNLLKIIDQKYHGLPVVILTGTVSWMQVWDKLKQDGACAFLVKPFSREHAKDIVERCLNGEKIDKVQ